ncbi:MAG: hypothetical protein Q8Q89_04545 [bacterium]|nr:hypothetical protein [bacterium]
MNLYNILRIGMEPLRDIDFGQIDYPQKETALWLAVILVGVILLKLLFSRDKSSQKCSGYFISSYYHQDLLRKFADFMLNTALAFGVLLFIIALADPFLSTLKTTRVINESRERIDLIDVSTSKGWEYLNTGKAAGEIGREAFLEFLKMRRGQNDRTSLWLFSSKPGMVEDFIVDDDLYMIQVEDAPYVRIDPSHQALPENDSNNYWIDIIAPPDRIEKIPNEGATKLLIALEAVIKYIDNNGSKGIKQRALLIETDAAVEEYPGEQLKELKKMNVGIYFLHIKPNEKAELQYTASMKGLENAKLLRQQVNKYGGKFYDVTDKTSIVKAYQDINRLETGATENTYTVNKIFLFQVFILLGVLITAIAIGLILIIDTFGVYP